MGPPFHARAARSPPGLAWRARLAGASLWALAFMVAFALGAPVARADASAPSVSTAIFYGPELPLELLAHFDRLIVDPDRLEGIALPPPGAARALVLARVNVGEARGVSPWIRDVPPAAFLGARSAGGTGLTDLRAEAWRTFVVERVVEPLWARGYRGFHLDGLDAFRRAPGAASQATAFQRGAAALVDAIRARHPDAKITLESGFDVAPRLALPADGIVTGPLYASWNSLARRYEPASKEATDELLARVAEARRRGPLPVTVVDALPSSDRDARRADALRILRAGVDPWVTGPDRDEIGMGRTEIVPRRVLLVYKHNSEGYLGIQDACVLVAPILEWLGYAVDYADVRQPLPAGKLAGRYAGIVTLVPEGVDEEGAYAAWLLRQMDAGLRVAFLESFGFTPDAAFLARLGLAPLSAKPRGPVRVAKSSPYTGFEAPLRARLRERVEVKTVNPGTESYLRIEDADKLSWDGVVIGPWGGAAFAPYVLEERLEQERRWILDPFKFLHDALGLPQIPAPDVTTESGRRILTTHIDGDAFVSRAERRGAPFTAEIVRDELLKRYPIPHTVSVVEGEVGPAGLYPKDSPRLEAIAREIFRLPNVELATHLYSHPFEWEDAEAGKVGPPPPYLPIPGYVFDLRRDIQGSVDYINSRLAPPGKRVKVVQWSGSCSPSARAVALAGELGLFNVNGGGATRTRDLPSLTRGSAMGIPKAPGVYQVFAPVENENVYTNDWKGPYYGYRLAIETFELNERPRRLSTIPIYYHFYSAAKAASLEALEEVYAWALRQETTPLYLSEYAAKVVSFQRVTLGRHVDDLAWEVGNLGALQTLRVEPAWGWPDLSRSRGVAGVRDAPQGRYVTLAPAQSALLAPVSVPPGEPYLENCNGRVVRWEPSSHGVVFRIQAHAPVVMTIAGGASGCAIRASRGSVSRASIAGKTRFAFADADTGEARLECK